jgi:hypothetical protein
VLPGLAHRTDHTGQCPVHQGGLPSNSSPSGFSGAAHYNSPDCPVPHRTVRCPTGLSGAPPDSVRCSREKRLRTSQLRENGRPLRYNSPDCPVRQRSNGYLAPTVDSNSEQCATVHAAEVRAEGQRGTGLSGVHRTVRCHMRTKPPTVDQLQPQRIG